MDDNLTLTTFLLGSFGYFLLDTYPLQLSLILDKVKISDFAKKKGKSSLIYSLQLNHSVKLRQVIFYLSKASRNTEEALQKIVSETQLQKKMKPSICLIIDRLISFFLPQVTIFSSKNTLVLPGCQRHFFLFLYSVNLSLSDIYLFLFTPSRCGALFTSLNLHV